MSVFGLRVPLATAEDLILFKLASWRIKDIPDVVAAVKRYGERLDRAYLAQWAAWFAAKNPCFLEIPKRLGALLAGLPLPPTMDG